MAIKGEMLSEIGARIALRMSWSCQNHNMATVLVVGLVLFVRTEGHLIVPSQVALQIKSMKE